MFFKLILQANSLEAKKKDLLKEKGISWKEFKNKKTKTRRYGKCCLTLWKKLGDRFKFPKDSYMYRLLFKLRHDGTYENFLIKSIAGFLGGFFLTYIFFMFFVLQLNFKLSTAMIMCSIFGSILTIGLAFSYKVRCIVFLVLPQFFSKKGRQALLAYAYILAITGPAKNTLNNMSILGESLACGQEQLKAAVRQILDVIKKPFLAIRDAIRAVVKAVKKIVIKIKEILLSIKRIILSILKVIKAAFKFLANIMNMCNKEIGTPFERCKRVFENAITDCNAKLGPLFNWLCNITYLVENVCYIVKLLDYICIVVDFVKDTVSSVVLKVKQFVRHIRVMFYVRIKFSHSYHFESNHSKSMSEITTGIVTEIKERSSGLIKIFDFMSSAASVFFIFMVVKVMYYRQKFLTNERFDNKFITKDFTRIDLRRAQLGKETVLPLNHRERQQYVTTSSLRLVNREKSQLSQAAMILLMATLKLSTHMATDYSLYWIMTLIRFYGRFQSKIPAPNVPGLHIEGKGFLANLLRAIVKAFQPIGINLEIDTVPCLPDPIPPDYDRYIQIASLLVLCWFLAIFEPYGLRFRHSVMCYYHPQRARERSIWLYNNILRSRSSFLKFARRQLRRKVKGDSSISKVTFKDFLRARLNCRVCIWILGTKKQDACLLCGEVFRENDPIKPIKCQTPNCPGLYCERCFSDLQNLCTVCLDPIQYGDMSDISEEKDSSEDENRKLRKQQQLTKKKKKKKPRKSSANKKYDTDDDTNDEYDDSDKKSLIPKNEKDVDSDYFSSSGNTTTEPDTDYSYGYQDNKDITKMSENRYLKPSFVDVEKQSIPDRASLEEFRTHGTLSDEYGRNYSYGFDEEAIRGEQQGRILSNESAGGNIGDSLEVIDSGQLDNGEFKVDKKLQELPEYDKGQQTFERELNKDVRNMRNLSPSEIPEGGWQSSSSNITELNYQYATVPKIEKVNSSLEHMNMNPRTNSKISLINSGDDDEEKITSLSTKSSPYSIYDKREAAQKLNQSDSDSESSYISEVDSVKGRWWKKKDRNSKISTESVPLLEFKPQVYKIEHSETKFKRKRKRMSRSESSLEERAHPDVPKLNLKFLYTSEEENPCSGKTCSGISCNCRFFRNSVKYREVSETGRSLDTSSSLISEMQKNNFQLEQAETLGGMNSKSIPQVVGKNIKYSKYNDRFAHSGNYDFLVDSSADAGELLTEENFAQILTKHKKETAENLNVSNIHSASTRIADVESPKMLTPDSSSLISSLEHERFSFKPATNVVTVGKNDPSLSKTAADYRMFGTEGRGRRFEETLDTRTPGTVGEKLEVVENRLIDVASKRKSVDSPEGKQFLKPDKPSGKFTFGRLFKARANRKDANILSENNVVSKEPPPQPTGTVCVSQETDENAERSSKDRKLIDDIGFSKNIGISELPFEDLGTFKRSTFNRGFSEDYQQKSFDLGVTFKSTERTEDSASAMHSQITSSTDYSYPKFQHQKISVMPSILETSEIYDSSSTSYPNTQIRRRNPNRIISYSSPDSTLTYPFLSSPSKSRNSDFGSEDVLYPLYEDDGNIEAELDLADKLYRAKIREYYRHLKNRKFQELKVEKGKKKGFLGKLAGMFSSSKKKKVIL